MARKGENIYKRKDGRWEGRYIKERKKDGSIHYGYLYGKNYTTVRSELLLKKALCHHHYTQSTSTYKGTVHQWSEYWLTYVRNRVKQSTFTSYRNKMHHHILPLLGEYSLNVLTEKELSQWLKQLQKRLAPNSVRVVFQVLNTCLQEAVRKKILASNPCQEVQLPKPVRTTVRALTQGEQALLYKKAKGHDKGLSTILALESGLRIGEIAGLKWEDIDFEHKLLTVQRTVQRLQTFDPSLKKKTQLVESTPKSSSSMREIPLSVRMVHLLKKMEKKGPYLFQGVKPCDPRLIFHQFKQICKEAGVPSVCFHALRHSFATRCLEKGVTIATISSLLGHRSIKMTLDTYINSFLSEKRKAIQLIS